MRFPVSLLVSCWLAGCVEGGEWGLSVCAHLCVGGGARVAGGREGGRGLRGTEMDSPLSQFTPESVLGCTGGTEDKWISQVNKPGLKTF